MTIKRMRKADGTNCKACFSKECDCECETCLAARKRNEITPQHSLDVMNMEHAIRNKHG